MHPDGFHKDEEAKKRCWGCSKPELLEASPEDLTLAQRLVDEGWYSISRRYGGVARVSVPSFDKAITFSPDVPQWMREYMKRSYENWISHGARCETEKVEHLELTTAQFNAFKRLGGRTA